MARPEEGYEWTATEIQTHSGFTLGVGNKNPDKEETRFIVLRYDDERSSKLCKDIEAMSKSNGGIIINDQEAIKRGLSNLYRTNLFHKNCRCRLVLKPKSTPDEVDDVDIKMSVKDTAISRTELGRAEKLLGPDFAKKYTSFKYQKRLEMVMNVNESGRHYLHDRRGRK